jgi:hypothetical protein
MRYKRRGPGVGPVEIRQKSETKLTGVQLMRRYNWSLVDPLKPPIIVNNGVWETRDFWVHVEKR